MAVGVPGLPSGTGVGVGPGGTVADGVTDGVGVGVAVGVDEGVSAGVALGVAGAVLVVAGGGGSEGSPLPVRSPEGVPSPRAGLDDGIALGLGLGVGVLDTAGGLTGEGCRSTAWVAE